ncbi:hypothetical protein [Pontibaca salina]|uniref:Uncharacterized protein n=1 Tax=Pontibaca salina TaxID=2795731 RepID=A0A934HMT3_9RHOB|nr:hypothetical protein [Pontibaca salina]MBI6630963.1 hypothetical protein [Pontibaca salina]
MILHLSIEVIYIKAKKPSRFSDRPEILKAFLRSNQVEDTMSLPIKDVLAAKGITTSGDSLAKLESKWKEFEDLKGSLEGAPLDDFDLALKNTAGGDHHG